MGQRPVVDLKKLSLLVLVVVIVYNEFLAYYFAFSGWPRNDSGGSDDVVRILFVADPQIQGLVDEPKGLVGMITRWDSDRFLSKTFSWARSYYELDAIVFLGDLIDEGSRSDSVIFDEYVSRFFSIYPKSDDFRMIFTSGDNDIGGEGSEPVSKDFIERFNRYFPEKKSLLVPLKSSSEKNNFSLEVITMNVLKLQLQKNEGKSGMEVLFEESDNHQESGVGDAKMIISHIPLSPHSQSSFASKVLEKLKADVVFSAHYHHGAHIVTNAISGSRAGEAKLFKSNNEQPISIDLEQSRKDNLLHEIIVPTCSYRMGEREMAFGLAMFNLKENTLTYHNLWLPKRFAMLFLYVSALITFAALRLMALYYRKVSGGRKKNSSRRSSYSKPRNY